MSTTCVKADKHALQKNVFCIREAQLVNELFLASPFLGPGQQECTQLHRAGRAWTPSVTHSLSRLGQAKA